MLPKCLILFTLAIAFLAQAEDSAAIRQRLESQYSLTQATADETDIVTAGAVLVLKKGEVIMAPASSTNFYQNTYKDGKITQNSLGKGVRALNRLSHLPGAQAGGPATRTFVPGEKMWVTKIDVKDDGVVFDLFTDAFADVRYKASLRFAFAKGAMPPADQVEKVVAEVFKIQPADASAQQQAPAGQPATPAAPPSNAQTPPAPIAPPPPPAADAPPPPIAPPPPPADEKTAPPQTISLGQTKDQVVAILGQPSKIVKLATKETYYYKDLKVIFTDGKVTDVQ